MVELSGLENRQARKCFIRSNRIPSAIKDMMMKKKSAQPAIKPRNPLVAQLMFKRKGWKEKSSKAQRLSDNINVRCKLKDVFQMLALAII